MIIAILVQDPNILHLKNVHFSMNNDRCHASSGTIQSLTLSAESAELQRFHCVWNYLVRINVKIIKQIPVRLKGNFCPVVFFFSNHRYRYTAGIETYCRTTHIDRQSAWNN